MMTNRCIAGNPPSNLRGAANAINGMAKATPVSAAAPIAGINPQLRAAGNNTSTAATDALVTAQRTAIHNAWPPTMSAAPSGVAATPKYPRDHTKLPITGHMLSAAATTMAVVTIRPGAMYATYDAPPSTSLDVGVRSTRAPTATPRPSRY